MTLIDDIRPLRRGDLEAAAALIATLELFPRDLMPEMAAPALSGATGELWWIAGSGSGLAFAAPERLTDGTWNLLLLAVDPAVQRQGLGRALIATVERALREAGGRLLIVETSGMAEFAGARRFYRRLGFHREARIRDFYGPGDDKVIFTRLLAD
jgi:ribosomal protein S18 acetylase RimI-like enzyme